MRLIAVQRDALPLPQRVIYIETYFCSFSHEADHMTTPDQTPEATAAQKDAQGQVADAYRGNWVDRHAPAW